MNRRELTRGEIEEAISNKYWDFGNDVLYRLCESNPAHDRDDVIIAKVWLIGRSYAATIERRRETDGIVGDKFYEDVVAPRIRTSAIDNWFQDLRNTQVSDLAQSLKTHQQVVSLFRDICHEDKHSLASKYLHFHFPARFYIYDSRASKAISALCGTTPPPNGFEDVYSCFFARCEELNRSVITPLFRRLSPREFDKVLLHEAAGISTAAG
ncbi:MAG TPA: hypothetical protein VKS20_02825 [Candidatus Acidoferrales bacterium]|nr:hypothetical protein [Candidatus Acidoferrales bacterium]